jgi:sugar/nucleoside kinase (ribokinase family)
MAAFKYLTPKLRLDHNSLPESLVFSKTFHMVCSGARCCQMVHGILQRREELRREGHCSPEAYPRPIFVWEPVPDLCRPDELPDFYTAIKQVDVVSPNDAELAQYFGKTAWDSNNTGDQSIAERIVNAGIGPEGDGTLVIRAGKHGCHAYGRGAKIHLPAFHGLSVIDPTGAGNAFLGAVAEALVCSRQQMLHDIVNSVLGESRRWEEMRGPWGAKGRVPLTLMCATVAASFVIEQIGMPSISTSGEQEELWNGVAYSDRLREYARQLKNTLESR